AVSAVNGVRPTGTSLILIWEGITMGWVEESRRIGKGCAPGVRGPPKRTNSFPQVAQRPTKADRPAEVTTNFVSTKVCTLWQWWQKQQLLGVSPGWLPSGVGIHNPRSGTCGSGASTCSKATRRSDTVSSPGAWAMKVTGTVMGVEKRKETCLISWAVPGGTIR